MEIQECQEYGGYEEVRISMPFGFIAGKWWGRKDVQPVVAIHGLHDNAGTFDRLIPLLPKTVGYLAIELAGHGLSSKIAEGVPYHYMDNLIILEVLINEYKWKKISILAHSMGAILGFIFASSFPNKVEMVIALDFLKPQIIEADLIPDLLRENIYDFLKSNELNQKEPPSYTIEELIEKMRTNFIAKGSVTEECAPYILRRAIRKSEKYPNKYHLTRDNRLKYNILANFPQVSQGVSIEMAKSIKSKKLPYLFIKVKGTQHFEDPRLFNEVFEIMQDNPNFETFFVDGSHHIHLTEPEKIAPVISDFIVKNKMKNKL